MVLNAGEPLGWVANQMGHTNLSMPAMGVRQADQVLHTRRQQQGCGHVLCHKKL